ncbi:hypothetical protein GQ457_07G007490 [Hibiscus cannabinus]
MKMAATLKFQCKNHYNLQIPLSPPLFKFLLYFLPSLLIPCFLPCTEDNASLEFGGAIVCFGLYISWKCMTYQKEDRNGVKVNDLKPKRIKDYLEYKFSQKSPALLKVTVYKQAEQLFGLRHKPITLQDALPRSDPSRDNQPKPDPLSLIETSPLSSSRSRISEPLR